MMKKKVYSQVVKKTEKSPIDPNLLGGKLYNHNSDPAGSKRFFTEASEVIYERRSEDIKSSLDGDDESSVTQEEDNKYMNTLYVPNVEAEATRKRVSSFKKVQTPKVRTPVIPTSEPSLKKNKSKPVEIDPYLEDSDEEMIDTDIKKFISKNSSNKYSKESYYDLIDDDDDPSAIEEQPCEESPPPKYQVNVFKFSDAQRQKDPLIESALHLSRMGNKSKDEKKPFACDLASIGPDNVSDDMLQDSLLDPLEECEGSFKKGGGGYKKAQHEKERNKRKKANRTAKQSQKYAKTTKKLYDPSGKKRAAKEKLNKSRNGEDDE